jgi:putative transposase
LYFFDEIAGRHFSIPYRDTSLPPVSIWELREAHRRADEKGISHEDEKTVFALLTEQRTLEDDAAANTKSARRATQRRAQHAKARSETAEALPQANKSALTGLPPAVRGYDPDSVIPLDDD